MNAALKLFTEAYAVKILTLLAFASAAAVFIALMTLTIKKIFGNRLSPAFHYYIWIVFAVRLIFPFAPESGFSIYSAAVNIYENIPSSVRTPPIITEKENNLSEKDNTRKIQETDTESAGVSDANVMTENADVFISVDEPYGNQLNGENISAPESKNIFTRENAVNAAFWAYLFIAGINLAVYAAKYTRYRRRIIKSCVQADEREILLLKEIKKSLNIKKKITLFRNGDPMLIGVFSPALILPERRAGLDERAVITHELLHYKNKDNLVNIILSAVKYVYWFNPLIRCFIRKIKEDMEILCDVKSMNKLNYGKKEYTMMLFNSSNKNGGTIKPDAAMLSENGKQLKRRIKFISSLKKPSVAASVIAAVFVTVLMLTSLTNPVGAWENKYVPDPRIFITEVNGAIREVMEEGFIPDGEAVGKWEVVDFVKNSGDFIAGDQQFTEAPLFWLSIEFSDNGIALGTFDDGANGGTLEMSGKKVSDVYKWTKGLINTYNTVPEYEIKNIDGEQYMFVQWKSGDYTVRGMKPYYYVFKKTDSANPDGEWAREYTPDPRIIVTEVGGMIREKMDCEFILDEEAVGEWKAVDYVTNIEDFNTGFKNWTKALWWTDISIFDDGTALSSHTGEYRWTKGLIEQYDTVPEYVIKNIDGEQYMFVQWKSGDYTIRGMKPCYYVFKKES